ncbi:MAG: NYN domain-containing protein [Hyphomicrobiaceae bacterium]|nr:NYN domain-containing protein [Hyphomicrobiaceae bacterium]
MSHFDPRERIAIFIDGANLYQTTRALGFDIDYRRLLKKFTGESFLLRASYYTALAEDQEFNSIRPLVDWLDYNGYTVVTKPMKEFTDAQGQRRRIRSRLDVEMTIDALCLSESVDHVVLFTGDGDFQPLVAELQRRAKKVTVVSSLRTQPSMMSDALRRQADQFIDLADLEDLIGRDPSERPQRDRRAEFDDEDDDDDF